MKKRMSYSIVGKAWNELWDKEQFRFTDILITNTYIKNEDLGIFEVFVFDETIKAYISKGKNQFHPINDERMNFISWIKSLDLIS